VIVGDVVWSRLNKWLEIGLCGLGVGKSDKTKVPRLLSMVFSTAVVQLQSRPDPSRYMWTKLRLSEHVHVPHLPSGTAVFCRSGKADFDVHGLPGVPTEEDTMRRRTALPAVLVGRPARDVQVCEERPQDDGLAKVSPGHVAFPCL
jgi:hypothetical protein